MGDAEGADPEMSLNDEENLSTGLRNVLSVMGKPLGKLALGAWVGFGQVKKEARRF